jgi:hypothetical protein
MEKSVAAWLPNALKVMNKSTSPDMPIFFGWPHEVTY